MVKLIDVFLFLRDEETRSNFISPKWSILETDFPDSELVSSKTPK